MSGDNRPGGGANRRRGKADGGGPPFADGAHWEDRRTPPPADEPAMSQEAPSEPDLDAAGRPDPLDQDPPGDLDQDPPGDDDPPAFGVMLHLLGSVALAVASIIWAALLLFGVVASTGLKVLAVFGGLTLAVAWFAWLVRATMGREFPEDDESDPDNGGRPPGGA